MRIYDVIKDKRDGKELSKQQIDFFIEGIVNGEIADYQASALLMAIYFNGMTPRETVHLTLAIKNSGKVLDLSKISGIKADKHSTGGVGDKTSLIVAPIVASLGAKVAKMSGRGLGHTGGTIDKLESINGFNVSLNQNDFIRQVNEIGIAIIGQTENLAPADKKLYAIRDVTATVDSLPLIASSIMGKKLAVSDDVIVLDVKCGSGAFCKTLSESYKLAKIMTEIGKSAGKKIVAVVTDMSSPLGNSIGNSLEVKEAIEVLSNKGERDILELSVYLSAYILNLSGFGSINKCKKLALNAIQNGSALKKFGELIAAQGGDADVIYNTEKLSTSKYSEKVLASQSGYIYSVDAEGYGKASLALGGGRNKLTDKIDYFAGIKILKKTGAFVNKGDEIAVLYANDKSRFAVAKEIIISSTQITKEQPIRKSVILKVIK